jgi:RNA-binding protein PNO1
MAKDGEWKVAAGYGPARRKAKTAADEEMDTAIDCGDGADGVVIEPIEIEMDLPDEDEPTYDAPEFKPLPASAVQEKKQVRRIAVPAHRMTPLKSCWVELIDPLVQHLKLQVRMNTKRRCIEIRSSEHTPDIAYLQKGADFCKAFMLGFELKDSIALLRLDDLFIESFEVKDVKRLNGDHLSRAIGRLAGKDGKTKYAIENATRTRIVLADEKIHILGSFANMKIARNAVCSLILGSPPSKVYSHLRTVSKRIMEHV